MADMSEGRGEGPNRPEAGSDYVRLCEMADELGTMAIRWELHEEPSISRACLITAVRLLRLQSRVFEEEKRRGLA